MAAMAFVELVPGEWVQTLYRIVNNLDNCTCSNFGSELNEIKKDSLILFSILRRLVNVWCGRGIFIVAVNSAAKYLLTKAYRTFWLRN